jgi:hypothetical protein
LLNDNEKKVKIMKTKAREEIEEKERVEEAKRMTAQYQADF